MGREEGDIQRQKPVSRGSSRSGLAGVDLKNVKLFANSVISKRLSNLKKKLELVPALGRVFSTDARGYLARMSDNRQLRVKTIGKNRRDRACKTWNADTLETLKTIGKTWEERRNTTTCKKNRKNLRRLSAPHVHTRSRSSINDVFDC